MRTSVQLHTVVFSRVVTKSVVTKPMTRKTYFLRFNIQYILYEHLFFGFSLFLVGQNKNVLQASPYTLPHI